MIKHLLVGFAAALGMQWALATPLNIVVNGNFSASSGALATGWTQQADPAPGYEQYIGIDTTDPADLRHGGNVFFDGAFGSTGVLSQQLTTVVGGHYTISFDAALVRIDASGDVLADFFSASFGGNALFSVTDVVMDWTSHSFDVIAMGTSTLLEFQNRNSLNFNLLDNVSVIRTDVDPPPVDPGTPPTSVPEPTSVALLMLGLGLMARRQGRRGRTHA